MSRYACMIDSPNPDVFPLESGVAGFMPLDSLRFSSWDPKSHTHSEPVVLQRADGKHPRVGPYAIHREIVDLVETHFGPCKWSHSTDLFAAFTRSGKPSSSPIIWAWSADGKLRCIAAAGEDKGASS